MMYAAQMPTTRDSTRELRVVCRLLTVACPKPLLTNRLTKCSTVSECGMIEICPCISSMGRMAMAASQ